MITYKSLSLHIQFWFNCCFSNDFVPQLISKHGEMFWNLEQSEVLIGIVQFKVYRK